MDDKERIEEGRTRIDAVIRTLVATKKYDLARIVLVAVHDSAQKVFASTMQQGGRLSDEGWAILITDRSRLPAGTSIPLDQLPCMISAGGLNVVTSFSPAAVITASGGDA